MTRSRLILLGLVFLTASLVAQQRFTPPSAASLPANCNIGDLATKTTDPAGLYVCTATDTWTLLGAAGDSLPEGGSNGDVLSLVVDNSNPTAAGVLANHPEIMPTWAAVTDLTYGDSGDVVVCIHGDTGVFCGEIFEGDLTGAMEPDWDGNAPNVGDEITDGDNTYTRAFDYVDWPPTPTTWQADHSYTTVAFVYPTAANGHLYVGYCYQYTSGSNEPDFNSITFSNYIEDGDCYLMDAGTDGSTPPSEATWITPPTPLVYAYQTPSSLNGGTALSIGMYVYGDAANPVPLLQIGNFNDYPIVSGTEKGTFYNVVQIGNDYNIVGTTNATTLTDLMIIGHHGVLSAGAGPSEDILVLGQTGVGNVGVNIGTLKILGTSADIVAIGQDIRVNVANDNDNLAGVTVFGANLNVVGSNQMVVGDGINGLALVAGTDIKLNPTGFLFLHQSVVTSAPASGDCDASGETNRIVYDSTNDNLYVCSGASGWRKIATASP